MHMYYYVKKLLIMSLQLKVELILASSHQATSAHLRIIFFVLDGVYIFCLQM